MTSSSTRAASIPVRSSSATTTSWVPSASTPLAWPSISTTSRTLSSPPKSGSSSRRLVGKHVVRSGRWTTETAAEGLWNDIKKVNDLFVEKVAAEVKRIEKERDGEGKGRAAPPQARDEPPGRASESENASARDSRQALQLPFSVGHHRLLPPPA